jgi:hypothetical protein
MCTCFDVLEKSRPRFAAPVSMYFASRGKGNFFWMMSKFVIQNMFMLTHLYSILMKCLDKVKSTVSHVPYSKYTPQEMISSWPPKKKAAAVSWQQILCQEG